MKSKQMVQLTAAVVIVTLVSIGVIGCQKHTDLQIKKPHQTESTLTYKKIPLPLETFKRVMGWLTKDEILIHGGGNNEDTLYRFNILTGKLSVLYEAKGLILTSAISADRKKIFIQLADNPNSRLEIVSSDGVLLQEQKISTANYLNVNWNASNNQNLFLAYYESENHLKVLNWQLASNDFQEIPGDSLTPIWYSDHLYVYVDNFGEFFLTRGKLYLGDTRTGEKTELSDQVSNFYLTNDALITFTPSDFSEDALLLNYQYPFLVDQGFLEIPKMTMNQRLLFPYLSQEKRQAPIYGVFPKKAVHLELEAGDFQLARLNFKKSKVEPIVDLPDNAPIQISPDGTRSLYGWRFENVIDLNQKNRTPFFDFPKQK
ncbi:YqgU-like beta propeller domain-containing protein [Carnobacterium gallinarum]|uniref:YqgU-like beta propeller domain-containing protein n=1 Tax=Carnobacterium gallinarum TaxID=2749 RepID=UPI000550C690|nr:hypothetical protein [Carnobacterium gallinarum]